MFVAAWPDEATKEKLSALELERVKGLRPVGPSRWHVTLRFLGEVGADLVEPLGRALSERTTRLPGPAECRLGPGAGWFTGVRVLQLPAVGLDDVAGAVRAATVPLVPEPSPEEPRFNGHLTLARARGRRLGRGARDALAGIRFDAAFPVDHVDLVSSVPSPAGHVYSTLARAPLGPAGARPA